MPETMAASTTMNSKQKMLTAMTSGLHADFPVVIPYVGAFLRDHWRELTDQPWWTFQSSDLHAWLKVEEDLQRKLDMDWIDCRMCPSTDWRVRHRVEAYGSSVFLVDSLSMKKEELQRPPIGGTHIPIEHESLVQSIDDVNRCVDLEDRQTLVQSGKLDYVKMVAEKYGSQRFLCASIGTPYWTALCDYFGFKGMMVNLLRRPKLVENMLQRLLASTKELLRAYADVGVHGIWVEECLSSANEISLDKFREFALPYDSELISEIRRLGMKSIYYPCGNVADRLELAIETNPDCISLEEGKKGFEIDIARVDEIVAGRVCIFGNLDSIRILQNGTREELRREVLRQLDIGCRHGRFVMSLGSPVTPKTPASRVREYIEIVRR